MAALAHGVFCRAQAKVCLGDAARCFPYEHREVFVGEARLIITFNCFLDSVVGSIGKVAHARGGIFKVNIGSVP